MGLGISDAVTLSGRILDLVKAGATLEAQERIVDLRLALADVKDELFNLREEVRELKRAAALRDQLEFDGAIYWRNSPDGDRGGPFCPRCYDVDSKLVRLQHYPRGMGFPWHCMQCSKGYQQK